MEMHHKGESNQLNYERSTQSELLAFPCSNYDIPTVSEATGTNERNRKKRVDQRDGKETTEPTSVLNYRGIYSEEPATEIRFHTANAKNNQKVSPVLGVEKLQNAISWNLSSLLQRGGSTPGFFDFFSLWTSSRNNLVASIIQPLAAPIEVCLSYLLYIIPVASLEPLVGSL